MFRRFVRSDNDPAALIMRVVLGLAIALLLKGGGALSVDRAIAGEARAVP